MKKLPCLAVALAALVLGAALVVALEAPAQVSRRGVPPGTHQRIATSYLYPSGTVLANNLNLQTVATVAIPAPGLNGEVIVETYWDFDCSGAGDECDMFVMCGAAPLGAYLIATNIAAPVLRVQLKNDNSHTAQTKFEFVDGTAAGFGNAGADFTNGCTLTIQGRKRTDAANPITFYGYTVDVIRR